MAWNTSTLKETIQRVENDFSVKFFGSASTLRRSVLKTLARVWGGSVQILSFYLGWIYDQCFAFSADGDQLDRHGQEIGVFRKPASFSSGQCDFTGVTGTILPQGTLFQTVQDKLEFATTTDLTIVAGVVSGLITAVSPGTEGNLDSGTVLELVSPIAGINDQATTDVISGGAEREADGAKFTTQDYRGRILFKKRNPPQGGALADYIIWATSVSPCTDNYVFPQIPEANSVTNVVANYNNNPPTMSVDEVQDVFDYLTDPVRKPVTADVRVSSVVVSNIIISADIRPLTTGTQASCDNELRALFKNEGTPASTVPFSQILSAMGGATGVQGVVITGITQDGSNVSDITLNLLQVATLEASFYSELV